MNTLILFVRTCWLSKEHTLLKFRTLKAHEILNDQKYTFGQEARDKTERINITRDPMGKSERGFAMPKDFQKQFSVIWVASANCAKTSCHKTPSLAVSFEHHIIRKETFKN